jgi:molybdenum cofactor cytidylyltransferase
MKSAAVVPAAGKGERFGGQKLLARVGADLLLDRTLASLLDAGVEQVVVVAAPAADLSAAGRLADTRVRIVTNADPSRGMFSSIQTGLAACDGDPMVVLPADMPFVLPHTVAVLMKAALTESGAIVPTSGGRRGHPIVLRRPACEALLRAPAASNVKDALAAAGLARSEWPVGDPGVLRDVDRPDDLR